MQNQFGDHALTQFSFFSIMDSITKTMKEESRQEYLAREFGA
jgi:hypothetical protein